MQRFEGIFVFCFLFVFIFLVWLLFVEVEEQEGYYQRGNVLGHTAINNCVSTWVQNKEAFSYQSRDEKELARG